jgi:hypothetical protein
MFEANGEFQTGFWDPLKDGVLEVVSQLQQDVRFGIATFTGSSTTCPLEYDELGTMDLNNYDAVAQFYDAAMHPGASTETPTAAGVQAALTSLQADPFTGPKFILLVTDGSPDYCDNPDPKCPADTLVWALQEAYNAGIGSFVLALPGSGVDVQWLTAFANAGAGQSVLMVEDTQYCAVTANGSEALFPAAFPQGTYGAANGPATHFDVDPANRDELVNQIASVVAGVKSCEFDLQNELTIVSGLEGEGMVFIETVENPEGEAQPYDPTGVDGWTVNDGSQVELVGSSCDKLRDPNTIGISFGFPCEILIPK